MLEIGSPKPLGSRPGRAAGHSLLEAILACMIFVTVVTVLTSVWMWYGRSVAASRYVLVGTQLGEELIEQCVAAGFEDVDQLQTQGGTRDITMRTTMRGQQIEVVYRCTVEVDRPTTDLKRVKVRVSWEDQLGPEEIRFETLLFRQE